MYLERWAIDELTELSVTLLRSVYQPGIDRAEPGLLARTALEMESSLTSEAWSDEVDAVLSRTALGALLTEMVRTVLKVDGATAAVAAEAQEPRDVREGDVYWLLAAEPLPEPQRGADAERLLAACRGVSVQVLDVTPVARHAAKAAYTQALLRTQAQGGDSLPRQDVEA